MTIQSWLALTACAGLLGLALLSIARGAKSPLALPLALLCMVFFSWNLAQLAHDVSGHAEWRYLDVALSPLTAPSALYFVVVFVGRWRELRLRVLGAFAALGLLSLSSLGAFVSASLADFAGSARWALTHLIGALLVMVYAFHLLWRHLRSTGNTEEQNRTRLVLAAFAIAGVLAVTELFADLGIKLPRGGHIGAFAGGAVLSIVALRFRLLEREPSSKAAVYSLALAMLAVIAYLGVFYVLAPSMAMIVLGTVTVTLALGAGMRQMFTAIAAQRERRERLALLGRFSAQMAHDLKNPLSAVKGAVQYLKEERRQGRSIDERAEFIELIGDQIERLTEVVEGYERLGRVRPDLVATSVNDAVQSVLALQRFAGTEQVEVVSRLAAELPPCPADRELLTRALENLVRNAFEAMPEGGRLEVETSLDGGGHGAPRVVIAVGDTGQGMDARTAERAFDDFYTTKAQGSGLGLAFVRRVAEAHGGDVKLASEVGKGTRVALRLPLG
jgi:two-component system, NtrC family, sensor histidine kinase HydH